MDRELTSLVESYRLDVELLLHMFCKRTLAEDRLVDALKAVGGLVRRSSTVPESSPTRVGSSIV